MTEEEAIEALEAGEQQAVEAARLDPAWNELYEALHDWGAGLFRQSLGDEWPPADAEQVLRAVSLECQRAGYEYGSPTDL